MTATYRIGYAENLSEMTIGGLVQVIRGYGTNAERTPSEHLQELKIRTNVSHEQAGDIHAALLTAYDVIHSNQIDLQPAIIATVNRLAKNNHLFSDQMMISWVEKGLSIVDNDESNEYLTSAAISLLNSQFRIVKIIGNMGKQVEINELGDISSVHDNRIDVSKKLLERCIDLMNHRDSGISSAATALLSKQWNELSDQQKEAVINQSINLVDAEPVSSCTAINLINNHLLKSDYRRETIANKCINILLKSDNSLQCLATAQQRLAAAQYAKNYIEGSSAPAERKANALHYCQGLSRNSGVDNPDEVAIFTEALQTLEVQAGGTTYSQTPIASTSTNGHRPARAAQPHQPATNPAALERAALAIPSR
jgi:hypothetical protein